MIGEGHKARSWPRSVSVRMSTSRGSGAGNGGGVQIIPAGARKVVQSLKEIVSCSDADIYAALKDCNMDPNEAVNRLLSQGILLYCPRLCLCVLVCLSVYFGVFCSLTISRVVKGDALVRIACLN